MAGNSDDAGFTPYLAEKRPFIVLASIAIPDKYFWKKIFHLKVGSSMDGIKISSDGKLLIAHSG
jgi:hypothetical protein